MAFLSARGHLVIDIFPVNRVTSFNVRRGGLTLDFLIKSAISAILNMSFAESKSCCSTAHITKNLCSRTNGVFDSCCSYRAQVFSKTFFFHFNVHVFVRKPSCGATSQRFVCHYLRARMSLTLSKAKLQDLVKSRHKEWSYGM